MRWSSAKRSGIAKAATATTDEWSRQATSAWPSPPPLFLPPADLLGSKGCHHGWTQHPKEREAVRWKAAEMVAPDDDFVMVPTLALEGTDVAMS